MQTHSRPSSLDPSQPLRAQEPLESSFPSSHKVYSEVEHRGVTLRVPMRRIHLAGGEPPVDVYDTSGPQGFDPHAGLPKLRAPWIEKRVARGDANVTQMHYARRGIVTPEMEFVALREQGRQEWAAEYLLSLIHI